MKIRIRVEFKIQDCWLGVFWKQSDQTWIQDEDQQDNAIWKARKARRLDIWICILPCLPVHILLVWRERLLTEQETLDDMVEF